MWSWWVSGRKEEGGVGRLTHCVGQLVWWDEKLKELGLMILCIDRKSALNHVITKSLRNVDHHVMHGLTTICPISVRYLSTPITLMMTCDALRICKDNLYVI